MEVVNFPVDIMVEIDVVAAVEEYCTSRSIKLFT